MDHAKIIVSEIQANQLNQVNFEDILTQKDKICATIQQLCDSKFQSYGLKINSYKLTSLTKEFKF